MAAYQGLIGPLDSYSYQGTIARYCEYCKKTEIHETYCGNTFAEGSDLLHCLVCGQRSLDTCSSW
jgi:hypothetical protein